MRSSPSWRPTTSGPPTWPTHPTVPRSPCSRQDGTVEVWDLAAGSARTIGDGMATAIAFVDDGHVIIGTYEGRVDVVDIATGLTEATIDGSTLDYPIGVVTSVAGKGDLAAIGDSYSDVWVWERSRTGSPKQVNFDGSGGQGCWSSSSRTMARTSPRRSTRSASSLQSSRRT